ncbi:hypothetical protein NMY22_g9626 [Coprinellus aureogranulatus]|nr:hypothetical protein NMY22_g9626 [Coprinellus aureogranulatus]
MNPRSAGLSHAPIQRTLLLLASAFLSPSKLTPDTAQCGQNYLYAARIVTEPLRFRSVRSGRSAIQVGGSDEISLRYRLSLSVKLKGYAMGLLSRLLILFHQHDAKETFCYKRRVKIRLQWPPVHTRQTGSSGHRGITISFLDSTPPTAPVPNTRPISLNAQASDHYDAIQHTFLVLHPEIEAYLGPLSVAFVPLRHVQASPIAKLKLEEAVKHQDEDDGKKGKKRKIAGRELVSGYALPVSLSWSLVDTGCGYGDTLL